RTVTRNVAYGLEIQRLPKNESRRRAERFVELVGLKGFEESYPLELSGGMQPRVNLARALAVDPEILLRVWSETRKTAIFITHDIAEAVYLADRVFVFTARPGRLKETIAIGLERPRDLRIKHDPRFVAIETRIWESIREEAARDTMAASA